MTNQNKNLILTVNVGSMYHNAAKAFFESICFVNDYKLEIQERRVFLVWHMMVRISNIPVNEYDKFVCKLDEWYKSIQSDKR